MRSGQSPGWLRDVHEGRRGFVGDPQGLVTQGMVGQIFPLTVGKPKALAGFHGGGWGGG